MKRRFAWACAIPTGLWDDGVKQEAKRDYRVFVRHSVLFVPRDLPQLPRAMRLLLVVGNVFVTQTLVYGACLLYTAASIFNALS